MNVSVEKLEYIDKFLDDYINNLIVNVLNLKTDHEKYSALIINNIILCYIDFENQMGCSSLLSVNSRLGRLAWQNRKVIYGG